jgi:hypothetical protein
LYPIPGRANDTHRILECAGLLCWWQRPWDDSGLAERLHLDPSSVLHLHCTILFKD